MGNDLVGVFKPNRAAPVHRWISFTEGFSAQLVHGALETAESGAFIFDPFGGTGTTPVVAVERGFNAGWAEVNPFLREVAETKVAALVADGDERREALAAIEVGPLAHRLMVPPDHPLLVADRERGFFPVGRAEELLRWIIFADQLASPLARRLVRIAVASSAIKCSNMKRAVDLRRRTEKELRGHLPDVDAAVHAALVAIAHDLAIAPVCSAAAFIASSDARALPQDMPGIDKVVTSPPYLNGTNYCRNTKLELLLLGYLQSESGLREIRARAITAGINNVSRRIGDARLFDPVEEAAVQLDEVAYDRRIPQMVRSYFSDMCSVFQSLASRMAPRGDMLLDIGDSRFAGVHIDTPQLLIHVAGIAGWHATAVEVIRARTAKDGAPLCQKLIKFCLT